MNYESVGSMRKALKFCANQQGSPSLKGFCLTASSWACQGLLHRPLHRKSLFAFLVGFFLFCSFYIMRVLFLHLFVVYTLLFCAEKVRVPGFLVFSSICTVICQLDL